MEVEVGVPLVTWPRVIANPWKWSNEVLDEIYLARHARYMPPVVYDEEIFFPPSFNREAFDREWRDVTPPFVTDDESEFSSCDLFHLTPVASRSSSPLQFYSQTSSETPRESSPANRQKAPPARMGRGVPAIFNIHEPRVFLPHGMGHGGPPMGRGAPSRPARRPGGLQELRE